MWPLWGVSLMESLLHNCAEVSEPIELSLGILSWGQLRDGCIRLGSMCPKGKGRFEGISLPLV